MLVSMCVCVCVCASVSRVFMSIEEQLTQMWPETGSLCVCAIVRLCVALCKSHQSGPSLGPVPVHLPAARTRH